MLYSTFDFDELEGTLTNCCFTLQWLAFCVGNAVLSVQPRSIKSDTMRDGMAHGTQPENLENTWKRHSRLDGRHLIQVKSL